MAVRSDITPEVCRELFRYDEETGRLFWKDVRYRGFHAANRGKEAFPISDQGYRKGKVHGIIFQAHRIIFAITYGRWPEGEIDHINGDRLDNRLCNLREVTPSVNRRNMRRRHNATGPMAGVRERFGRWIAYSGLGQKNIHIGAFATKEEAIAARKKFNRENGFTERHGH